MFKEQIQADANNALKSGDRETADVLRLVLAAISSKEKEKRYNLYRDNSDKKEEDLAKKSKLSEDEITAVLSSEVKKRKDAAALYEQGNRPELAEKEKREIETLQKYLPEQLSADELKKLVEESIAGVGGKEIKDMGKVMADLTPKIKGRADSAEASRIVKELLNK